MCRSFCFVASASERRASDKAWEGHIGYMIITPPEDLLSVSSVLAMFPIFEFRFCLEIEQGSKEEGATCPLYSSKPSCRVLSLLPSPLLAMTTLDLAVNLSHKLLWSEDRPAAPGCDCGPIAAASGAPQTDVSLALAALSCLLCRLGSPDSFLLRLLVCFSVLCHVFVYSLFCALLVALSRCCI